MDKYLILQYIRNKYDEKMLPSQMARQFDTEVVKKVLEKNLRIFSEFLKVVKHADIIA